MRFPALFRLFAACLVLAVAPLGARTLVHCGALIDGLADAPKKEVTIVIDADRITSVTPGYTAAAAGDQVIDLTHATVMPGWIDCHVHLGFEQSATSYTEGFYMNPGDHALRRLLRSQDAAGWLHHRAQPRRSRLLHPRAAQGDRRRLG